MLNNMKDLYKQKREQGFTIIEVMIVLAIAAVILLIVLLAVPALQRNSRNTGRTNDAAQVAAAVSNCVSNNNGSINNCKTVGTGNVDIASDGGTPPLPAKLGQLNGGMPQYVAGGVGSINVANWMFGYRCVANAPSNAAPTPPARAIVVTFYVETSGADAPRCVES